MSTVGKPISRNLAIYGAAPHYLGKTFARPAAADLTRAALRAGAQTREGEKDLEVLLHTLAG